MELIISKQTKKKSLEHSRGPEAIYKREESGLGLNNNVQVHSNFSLKTQNLT